MAGGVRNIYVFILTNLIPVLADEELVEANTMLHETAKRLAVEKASRAAQQAGASPSATDQ